MDDKKVLKANLSQVLEILNFIILIYAIFLAVLGILIHNSELVIQTSIMFVVYIIFKYINYDYINVSDEGINCQKYGDVLWEDISKVKRKDRIIYIYHNNKKAPYKFVIKKCEDNIEIARVYKYILSKVTATIAV